MKILLAALMCMVLCTANCFALKGGPVYPGGVGSITGTYAGVLEPRFDPTDPFSSNSLGIFSLSVPATGLASGAFVMFSHGIVFKGTIQGLGNPNQGTIRGVLDASFSILTSQSTTTDGFFFSSTSSTTTLAARASGNLNAKVSGGGSNASAVSATLLRGTANLFISQDTSGSTSASPSPTASPTATPGSGSGSGSSGITAAFTLDVSGFKQSVTPSTASTGTTQ